MTKVAARAADLRRWWDGHGPALRHRCGVLLTVNVHGMVATATCAKCGDVWRESTLLGFNNDDAGVRFYFLQAPFEDRKRLVWVLTDESLHLASIDYVEGSSGFLDDGRPWWAWDYRE